MSSFLRQSTASQTRIIGPFIDDTDFKTDENALTINNTDVKLMKNGAASVNKNSGGGTNRVNGDWAFTFDATDSDTVGELEVSIKVTGALIAKKTFWVLEEAVYDALFASGASGFGVAQTGDAFARLGAPAGASVSADIATRLAASAYTTPPTVGAIADQVWDEILSGHLGAGSAGAALNGAGAAGDPWGTTLPGAYTPGSAGHKLGMLPDVIAGGVGGVTVKNEAGHLESDLIAIDGVLDGGEQLLAAIAQINALTAEVAIIRSKTDNLPSAIQRGVALPNFGFPMTDADGQMLTGLTVTALRRKDNGPFEVALNPVVEVGERIYATDIAAADLDANMIVFKFTASGAVPRVVTFRTEP